MAGHELNPNRDVKCRSHQHHSSYGYAYDVRISWADSQANLLGVVLEAAHAYGVRLLRL